MTAKEYVERYRGRKVRILVDNPFMHAIGKIGFVKEPNYKDELWISFDPSMNPRNTFSFPIDQLELVPDKIVPLPLPG